MQGKESGAERIACALFSEGEDCPFLSFYLTYVEVKATVGSRVSLSGYGAA